jgi:hypothetical protein
MLWRRSCTAAFAATLFFYQFGLLAYFASAKAEPVNHSGFVRIDGIEQWVVVTGDDRTNSIIPFCPETESTQFTQLRGDSS